MADNTDEDDTTENEIEFNFEVDSELWNRWTESLSDDETIDDALLRLIENDTGR